MSFDHVADIYDKTFTYSHIGRLQRELVHRYLNQWLNGRKGLKVLELNCGTGEDALFLAREGCEVLATDLSKQMVQVAREKLRSSGVEQQVRFQQMAIEELVQCPIHEQYDLIFSNFGGFNCIAPQDLANLQQALADRLRPGGYLVAVVMSSFCLWETAYFLAKGSWKQAFRRRSKEPVHSPLGNGQTVATWYFSPAEFSAHFEQAFEQKACQAVGFFLPPSYLETAFSKRSVWLHRLNRWELAVQRQSFLAPAADHYLLSMQKRDSVSSERG